jgi:deoxyribodipyrimidine photo-lyase
MRALHWFRNDLRLDDNTALAESAGADALVAVFVLDDAILLSPRTGAPRVRFLVDCLARLAGALEHRGSKLVLRRGDPATEIPRLAAEAHADLVTWNRCDTPLARRRDARVRAALDRAGVRVVDCRDHVMFQSSEVRTVSGGPYAVYTPYRNAWHGRLAREPQPPVATPRLPPPVPGIPCDALPDAKALGFGGDETELPPGGEAAARTRLERFLSGPVRGYARDRDYPAIDGTSRLSPYLRFGAISVRTCVDAAQACARDDRSAAEGARKWIDELVWRDFYHAVLAEHPRVQHGSYRREFDTLEWNDDPQGLTAWREGRTGYPIVDAAMRQLATTGWMHNRLRMIVASFLTKDLLVDWRLGEDFFFRRLADGDPASNNGGWQWASSTGTDAQPYFRIFNPVSQGTKFDPDGEFVRRFIPELAAVEDRFVHAPWEAARPPKGYPDPIVSHSERRILALRRYEAARARARAR